MTPSALCADGRLACTAGHRWPAVPRGDWRKVEDPVGALWREADATVRAWGWT